LTQPAFFCLILHIRVNKTPATKGRLKERFKPSSINFGQREYYRLLELMKNKIKKFKKTKKIVAKL
jgi:hypothetical protein